MENQNTYYLKLQGKANIPVPLGIGHNYRVTSDCSITQEQKIDNEDGSFSIVYKAEPITCEVGVNNGPTIKAKDPRKNSVKLRNYLFKEYTNSGVVHDFDRVYDEITLVTMLHMNELLTEAIKRIEENEKS